MGPPLKFLIVLIVWTSCGQSYRTGNVKKFNKLIEQRTDLKTPEDLITFYYDPDGYNSKTPYKIIAKKLDSDSFEITLTQENIEDDSVFAEKVVLIAKQNGDIWTVSDIKLSSKCQSDRGHQDWQADPCE
jgi:hypothetical protein